MLRFQASVAAALAALCLLLVLATPRSATPRGELLAVHARQTALAFSDMLEEKDGEDEAEKAKGPVPGAWKRNLGGFDVDWENPPPQNNTNPMDMAAVAGVLGSLEGSLEPKYDTRNTVGTFDKQGNFKMEEHTFNAGVRRRWNRRTKAAAAGAHWRVNSKGMIVYGEAGGKPQRFVNREGNVVFVDKRGHPEKTETWEQAGESQGGFKEAKGAPDDGQDDNVKREWCQWGTQMVPCAPGFGGAWYAGGQRNPDYGIWPKTYMTGRGVASDCVGDSCPV
ncbi:hypothetical protein T484DRAFT_1939109 [Baffinella frigidus]|nr:hypothetical protein T484DRAFT_1939109 [Cryptophyta sp. CCMP2293]